MIRKVGLFRYLSIGNCVIDKKYDPDTKADYRRGT
jgi:hypothetical protein